MKRYSYLMIAGFVAAAAISPAVYATDTGTISNTGPGSVNTITFDDSCEATVTNNNKVTVSNTSSQSGSSGSATSSGNTTAGGATSGSVLNSNSLGVDIVIHNDTPALCVPGVTPTTPTENGGGQVGGTTTTAGGVGGAQELGVSQVAAPVGGVAAGAGGISSLIFTASMASGSLGLYRLRNQRRA